MNHAQTISMNFAIDDRAVGTLNDVKSSRRSFSSLALAMILLKEDSEKLDKNLGSMITPLPESLKGSTNKGMDALIGALINTGQPTRLTGMTAMGGLKLALGGLGTGLAVDRVQLLLSWFGHSNTPTETSARWMSVLSQALEESRQAHREAIREVDATEQANRRLFDRLVERQEREALTAREWQESIILTERLNKQIEGLNLTINISTVRLDENAPAVLGVINSHNDLALILYRLHLYQERWLDVTKGHVALEAEAARLTDTKERVRQIYEHDLITADDYTSTKSLLQRRYNGIRLEQAKFSDEMANLTSQMDTSIQRWEDIWMHLARTHPLAYRDLSTSQRETLHQMVDRWQIYAASGRKMFREFITATQLHTEVGNKQSQKVRKSLLETKATYEEVMEVMMANMRKNREATREWFNNLTQIG